MLDLDETSSSSSYSNHHPPFRRPRRSGFYKSLTVRNTKFLFCSGRVALVGSCNGLLCLRSDLRPLPLYYICNPVLGELVVLPPLTFLVNYSGFGFCPKTKKYKVVCFICLSCTDPMTNVLSTKAVVEICTLGTESWRRIGDAPCPLPGGSFDSFLNGNLHWLTNSVSASNWICSFDFETELFRSVPSPTHFDPVYVHKISWINVGVLGGQLCLCYIIGDAEFDVWVMKDYGVQSSWTREFVIDIKFYCGLNVDNLNHPIRFLNNGDLLFISDSKSIVSYSPRKGTFKNFKALGTQNIQAITHIPSFVSLKDMARGKTVKLNKWKTGEGMHIYITS
ncbi:F-box protein At3g07870-like [Actinidia eriantha]|uniref:F-box protein At3g07870-like n=1 Tax=Actinidia eriantha TaxID=165200 RepID=UPI002585FBA4|nr:F-box protein At3g07870-like [Actinidia eriantha]